MDSQRSSTLSSNGGAVSQLDFVRGERARALRAQLADWHPECSSEEIEDAVQTACKRFLEHAEGITAPGEVYVWMRTTAHRQLNRETARHVREFGVDLIEERLAEVADEGPGPDEDLIEGEDDADLARLVAEVYVSLPGRQRDILALWATGHRRPQIAERLGLTQRKVKRELLEIMEEARGVLARMVGGGCRHGEPLVVRFVCGLTTSVEEARAREHLARCRRCDVLCERLIAWREKARVTLPAPVAEGTHPGVVERFVQGSADRLAAAKQQILDGGAQLKQQAVAGYYRAVDPTPLAAARPGTLAAVIASCVAVGGGAATYCVEKGVSPIGAASGLIASTEEPETPQTEPPDPAPQAPVYTPVEPPPETEEPPAPEPTQPAAEETPEPEPKPEPEKAPPVEDNFKPVHTDYMAASEAEPAESYESPEEPAPVESSPRPAPVPAGAGPQFGGP